MIAVTVDTDKVTRASAVTPLVEAGRVLLPESAGWLDDYIEELSTFPASQHDDYVDSTTQALNWLRAHQSHYALTDFYKTVLADPDAFDVPLEQPQGRGERGFFLNPWPCPMRS